MPIENQEDLERALAVRSLSLNRLCERAEAVFIFGSRAAGCWRPNSDWDLLCIGPDRTHRDHGLDVVWVSSDRVANTSWLTSELAGHVAHWGILVAGRAPWRDWIRDAQGRQQSKEAASRKQRLIQGQARGLLRISNYLTDTLLHAEFDSLRRELQRYANLRIGQPVPPTAHLDTQWALDAGREGWLELCSAAQLSWGESHICKQLTGWLDMTHRHNCSSSSGTRAAANESG